MIKQTEFDNREIRRYGCLFLSLLEIAERVTGVSLTSHVEKIYGDLVRDGVMDANCYVRDHAAVINAGLADSGFFAKYVGAQYVADIGRDSWGGVDEADFLILQGKTKRYRGHFFRPEYNPDPTLEIERLWSIRAYKIAGGTA